MIIYQLVCPYHMLQDPQDQGYARHQLLLLHEHLVQAYPKKIFMHVLIPNLIYMKIYYIVVEISYIYIIMTNYNKHFNYIKKP